MGRLEVSKVRELGAQSSPRRLLAHSSPSQSLAQVWKQGLASGKRGTQPQSLAVRPCSLWPAFCLAQGRQKGSVGRSGTDMAAVMVVSGGDMQRLVLLMHELGLLVTREVSGRQTLALARKEEGSLASAAQRLPRPWRGHKGPRGNTAGRHMPMPEPEGPRLSSGAQTPPTRSLLQDKCTGTNQSVLSS